MTRVSQGSERRSYRKGVERRQQILDHAIELFAEHGVDGASLRSVGEAIGVSHAALRHYFSSRDELLVEVYRAHEQQVATGTEDDGAVENIARSADRNRGIAGLVALYATLSSDALQEQHPASREFVRERFDRVRSELTARIVEGQRAGRIAADIDATDAASLVIAASDGLQIQWLLAPETVDVRRSLELLERFLPNPPA
jgi:AcrR family transcriptional regulator